LKRRTFIQSVYALGAWAGAKFELLAGAGPGSPSEPGRIQNDGSGGKETAVRYTLETLGEVLQFDASNGQLVSYRSRAATDQEFMATAKEDPVFTIDYLDEKREFRQLTSAQAREVKVTCDGDGAGKTLTAAFGRIADLDLRVAFQVKARPTEKFSRWSLTLTNDAGIQVVSVQFPFVVCAFELGGLGESVSLVLPSMYDSGRLIRHAPPKTGAAVIDRERGSLPNDSADAWHMTSGTDHYPGEQLAQFLAYYNDRAGIYLACEDTDGHVKQLKVLNRPPGLRLGVAHFGDWPNHGSRRLNYDIVLGSFRGDWYDGAEIYRAWSLRQKWATPLHKRTDVPTWLLDSPVHVSVHPEWDADLSKPTVIPKEFLPFEKCIPLLEKIADQVQAPLAVMMMGWERTGAWSYPDSMPWIGGEDSLKNTVKLARDRGWRVGTYCNGSRWVFRHKFSGYDGGASFKEHGGADCVCRTPKGDPVLEDWDRMFRSSYECCLGAALTRRIAVDQVTRMIGWGFEPIQFFDQNVGAATFPCYALNHEHPPGPGKWMTGKMEETMAEFRLASDGAGARGVTQSAEQGVNEYCLPLFQETDSRLASPGYLNGESIPLYQFLFHECIVITCMFGSAAAPYHMQIKSAASCVWGAIPGGVLTGDGTFLNKDTPHFSAWEPKGGSDEDAFEMVRTVTALRRGPGKDFLLFGRMLKPAAVDGIQMMEWTYEKQQHRVPSVFHAAWEAPGGRFGIVLANWTTQKQTLNVRHARLPGTKAGDTIVLQTSDRSLRVAPLPGAEGYRTVTLAPLSCAIIAVAAV